jgi:serine/threonine protein kinase
MAPEQARNEEVDARCDLFSLGCVLYHLCAGEKPFAGTDAMSTLLSLATEHSTSPRQRNPEVPPALNNLILRLLAKDRADRPSSARAVIKTLEAIERELAASADLRSGAELPCSRTRQEFGLRPAAELNSWRVQLQTRVLRVTLTRSPGEFGYGKAPRHSVA